MDHKNSSPDLLQHVSTKHLRGDLQGRLVRSGLIKLSGKTVHQILGIGSAIVLVRLLTPEHFGLLAMVASLSLFISNVRDFGLPMATVHHESLDYEQVNRLFWLSLKFNVLALVFLASMAPVLAWFYGESRLTLITLAMAGGSFCIGLTLQHRSLLERQMRFGTLMFVDIGSTAAGVAAGIGGALFGWQYWALVLQFVTAALTKTGALWVVCGWRPVWRTRRLNTSIHAFLSYGMHLTGYRVLILIGRQLDRVLVGYFGGATALGLYSNSFRWSHYPVQQLQAPLSVVAVAGLSRIQGEPDSYRASCKKAFLPVFTALIPTLTFLFLEARSAILIMLGDQWLDAVPLFRLLCLAAIARSVNNITDWLYLSQGHTRRQLQWGLIYAPVMVAAVALGAKWGAYGVAVGVTVACCLLIYPGVTFCLKTSHLTMRDFHDLLSRPALAALATAVIFIITSPLITFPTNMLVEFLIRLLVFGMAYCVTWVGLPGGVQAARDLLDMATEVRPSRTPGQASSKSELPVKDQQPC